MGKSKNKNGSEVQFLRGEIRRLKAELKYFKRRDHIEHTIIDAPVEDVNVKRCPECDNGVLIEYDFVHLVLKKCTECPYQLRKKK